MIQYYVTSPNNERKESKLELKVGDIVFYEETEGALQDPIVYTKVEATIDSRKIDIIRGVIQYTSTTV